MIVAFLIFLTNFDSVYFRFDLTLFTFRLLNFVIARYTLIEVMRLIRMKREIYLSDKMPAIMFSTNRQIVS